MIALTNNTSIADIIVVTINNIINFIVFCCIGVFSIMRTHLLINVLPHKVIIVTMTIAAIILVIILNYIL